MVKLTFKGAKITELDAPYDFEKIKEKLGKETLIVSCKEGKNLFYITFLKPYVEKETEEELVIKDEIITRVGITVFKDSIQVYPD